MFRIDIYLFDYSTNMHEQAVQHGIVTIRLFQTTTADKSNLQNAYKMVADIYFTKSLDSEHARYSDYKQAYKYYKLEKTIIDTMVLEDIPDYKPGDLEQIKQSNCFNVGVMAAKIPTLHPKALENLQEAILLAEKLRDPMAEKSAWWEMGNLFKHTKQYDNLKYCQNKEMAIIKKHGLDEEYFIVFEEKGRLHY